jgi:hypothetical protein
LSFAAGEIDGRGNPLSMIIQELYMKRFECLEELYTYSVGFEGFRSFRFPTARTPLG